MSDIVITVPKRLWAVWLSEGDLAHESDSMEASAWSGMLEHGFTMGGSLPGIRSGERVYVVANGLLRGWAPLVAIESDARRFGGRSTDFALVRRGGAVACTIAQPIKGFQRYRYRWWSRSEEIPFPDWRTRGVS